MGVAQTDDVKRSQGLSHRWSAALAYVAFGGGSALRFIVQLVFSRTLGVVDFGRFVVARTWGESLASFADRGYGASVVRLLPEYAATDRGGAYRWLLRRGVISAVAGGVVLSVSAIVISRALGADDLTLTIGLALVPLLAAVRILLAVLLSQHRLHTGMLITEVLQPIVLMALAGAAFVAFRADAVLALVMLGVSLVAVIVLQALFIRPALPPRKPGDVDGANTRRTGMLAPMFVIQSSVVVYRAADVLIADLVMGSAAAGIYAAASRVAALSHNINNMVEGTAAPKLSAAHARGDRTELQAIIDRSISTALVPTLIVSAGLAAVGWFMLALFGPEFTEGYAVLLLLLAAGIAGASTGPSGNVLVQTDGHRSFAIIQAVLVGGHLPLAWWLTREVGLTGPAWSTLAVTSVTNLWLIIVAKRTRGLDVVPRLRHLREGVLLLRDAAVGVVRRLRR